MPYLPYQGQYKNLTNNSISNEEVDEYEVRSLCLKAGITKEDMEDMSFVSLINTLISYVDNQEKPKKATQEDIERFKGIL